MADGGTLDGAEALRAGADAPAAAAGAVRRALGRAPMLVYGDPDADRGRPREARRHRARRCGKREAMAGGDRAARRAGRGVHRGGRTGAGRRRRGVRGARRARRPFAGAATPRSCSWRASPRAVRSSWNSGFARFGPVPSGMPGALRAALPDTLAGEARGRLRLLRAVPGSLPGGGAGGGLAIRSADQGGRHPQHRRGARRAGGGGGRRAAAGHPAPVGHPFRRELSLTEELEAELLADPAAVFAVADEGPGLSGSSFGAVADFLERRGVAPGRVHFFPSHGGPPGPQASPAPPRALDGGASARGGVRRAGPARAGPRRAPAFLMGRPIWSALGGRPVGGDLRRLVAPAPLCARSRLAARPRPSGAPQIPAAGRRQALAAEIRRPRTRGRAQAGACARRSHAAGAAPAVAGYRHGFLLEEWVEGARPLDHEGWTQCAPRRARRALPRPPRAALPGRPWARSVARGTPRHGAAQHRGSPGRGMGPLPGAPDGGARRLRGPAPPDRDGQPAARLGMAGPPGRRAC